MKRITDALKKRAKYYEKQSEQKGEYNDSIVLLAKAIAMHEAIAIVYKQED